MEMEENDDEKNRGKIEVGPLCPPLKQMFFPWNESMEYLLDLKESKHESSSQST